MLNTASQNASAHITSSSTPSLTQTAQTTTAQNIDAQRAEIAASIQSLKRKRELAVSVEEIEDVRVRLKRMMLDKEYWDQLWDEMMGLRWKKQGKLG